MSDDTALVPTVVEPSIPVPTVHLVARNPAEMQAAQADLSRWLKDKLTSVEREVADLNAALNEAREAGWSVTALTRQRNKAVESEEYYYKLLAAVEAGYTIIPDFPIEVFAIRVDRSTPRGKTVMSDWSSSSAVPDDEKPDSLTVGEGEYVNPVPAVERQAIAMKRADQSPFTRHYARPSEFRDVAFPLRAARAEVMNATQQAMALKIFDRVGICPAKRKADPLIIGQVLAPKSGKTISFIIAWHLNLNEL